MINLDLSTLIDRPMKDVFAFVSNPNNMSEWNSAVRSVQQTTPGPVEAGTKFKTIGEALGRRIEGELQGNPGGLFKLAEGVMAGRVKSLMEENLARLKSVLEKGS